MSVKIKKIITLLLIAAVIVSAVHAYTYHSTNKKIEYSAHLNKTVAVVNGNELTLEDLAFYVAYEEKIVNEQAKLYNPQKPHKYWNVHTNGQFIRVMARDSAMSMAIHDEIFYQMALTEDIFLDENERKSLIDSQEDFWSDLEDINGAKKLGVSKETINKALEKTAIAQKYQDIYAQLCGEQYEEYDYSGAMYKKLLEDNEYEINEKIWKRVDFGKVTLD